MNKQFLKAYLVFSKLSFNFCLPLYFLRKTSVHDLAFFES